MALDVSRAVAVHDEACPEIGPICQVRAEPPQQHHTVLGIGELRLLGEYGLAPDFAVQASVPVRMITTRTRFTDLAGQPVTLDYQNIHHHDETLWGLGDVAVYGHSGLKLEEAGLGLGARLGLNLPLGRIQPNPYTLSALGLPHEHLQFGTGTFDPLLGLDVSHDFGPVALAGFGHAQLPLYQGRQGYRAGARLLAGAVVTSRLGFVNPTFRLGLTGFHESAERWDGVVPNEDGNQGRTDLYLGGGVTLPFAVDWSVSVDLRSRIYGRAVNAQLSLPLVVEVSVGRLLHLEDSDEDQQPAAGASGGDVVDLVNAGEDAPLTAVPGKWTVIDFWAPWCVACKTLDRELRERAAKDARLAVRRVNIVDFDSPIARRELPGVTVLPHVRVVDPSGKTVLDASGTPDELLRRLEAQLTHR